MMDINFENISYLESGTDRQRQAFRVLTEHRIMEKLDQFQPLLVGTIPLSIDIAGSDLDIVCCWKDAEVFAEYLLQAFGEMDRFEWNKTYIRNELSIVCNFMLESFPIEVFGQAITSTKQMGYRHMLIESKLLKEKGESFRQEIIRLKQTGLKTEPAFATLLGLQGDSYTALLTLET
jgi:hypothetical protein